MQEKGENLAHQRLTALFLAVSLLPLAMLALFSVRISSDAVSDEVRARIRSNADVSAVAVGNEMRGVADVVNSYAGRPSLLEAVLAGDRRAMRAHLEDLLHARQGMTSAALADPEGRLLAVAPATPSIIGKDFSYRDWYRGVTATGRSYVSEAIVAQVAGHPKVVAVADFVRAPDRRVAILVGGYDLASIQGFVDRFAAVEGVQLTVTDQRGTPVAGPRDHSDLVPPETDAAQGERSRVEARNTPSGRVIFARSPISDLDWRVTASVREGTALARVHRLRLGVLGLAGILGLVLMGAVAFLIVTLRARVRAEEAAHEAAERLAAIVQGSDDAILSKTRQGVITSWNRGAERLYGFMAEEAVGQPISIVIPDDRHEEEEQLLAAVFGGNAVEHYQTQRLRKDGTAVDVSLTVSPIRDDDGSIVAASTIARDITEQKRADAAIRSAHATAEQALAEAERSRIEAERSRVEAEQAKAEAERADRAKSDFLSRMSHELRTPMNSVLGFGQLLAMDGLDPAQKQSVDQILKAGQHLLDLINEVLDISRIEAGKLTLSIESVAAAEVVSEVLDLAGPIAAERNVTVESDVEGEGNHVSADRQRLKQVLLNLVSNAVKYNRSGGSVHVAIRQAGEKLRMDVSDTGPGIPPEQMDQLFAPFERLGAEQTQIQGTGLGLALSKTLVEKMGGAIGVESRVGEGSTFWVELAVAGEPLEQSGPLVTLPDITTDSAVTAPPRTVLYIEDNPSNVRLIEHVLAHRPEVRLLTAMEGQLGLDLARRHRPDLVLLDLHLPDIPGDKVLLRLREDPATREIPVVVLSADATPGSIRRLLDQGVAHYISKPLDVRRFLEILDETLRERETAS